MNHAAAFAAVKILRDTNLPLNAVGIHRRITKAGFSLSTRQVQRILVSMVEYDLAEKISAGGSKPYLYQWKGRR